MQREGKSGAEASKAPAHTHSRFPRHLFSSGPLGPLKLKPRQRVFQWVTPKPYPQQQHPDGSLDHWLFHCLSPLPGGWGLRDQEVRAGADLSLSLVSSSTPLPKTDAGPNHAQRPSNSKDALNNHHPRVTTTHHISSHRISTTRDSKSRLQKSQVKSKTNSTTLSSGKPSFQQFRFHWREWQVSAVTHIPGRCGSERWFLTPGGN